MRSFFSITKKTGMRSDYPSFREIAMAALTNLTLKQLATRVVVRENLPIKGLPNPLKSELEAFAMLQGTYTIIEETNVLEKCEGGDLTSEESDRVDYLSEKSKKKGAFRGDVGKKIKVTTVGGKRYEVERMGEDGVEASNTFHLKKKMKKGFKRGQHYDAQTFVNNGYLVYDFHAPAFNDKAKFVLNLKFYINQKADLVILSVIEQEGYLCTSKTIAQRN